MTIKRGDLRIGIQKRVNLGDYILKASDGGYYAITADQFKILYGAQ